MTKYRRKTYLIKSGLQFRYMGIIVIAMLLVAVFVGWVTYYTTWNTIANTPDLTLNGLSGIFETVNKTLVQWVFIFIAIIALLSIFVSHRIAGPVYRLEETTKLIASGDLTHRVHLRQGDELMDLQDAFNTMSDSLASMINKDREIIERLIITNNDLRKKISDKNLNSDDLEQIRKELDSITNDLQSITSTFKTSDNNLNDNEEQNTDKTVDINSENSKNSNEEELAQE